MNNYRPCEFGECDLIFLNLGFNLIRTTHAAFPSARIEFIRSGNFFKFGYRFHYFELTLVCAKLYGDIDILDRDRFCMKILKFWTVFQCEIGKQTKENPKTEQSSSVSHTNPSKRNLHFFTSNTVQKDLSPLTKFKKTLRVTPHLYPAFCQKLIPLYTYSPPLFVVRVSISFQSTCFIRKLRRRRAQISLHSRNFVKKLCSEKTRGTLLSP